MLRIFNRTKNKRPKTSQNETIENADSGNLVVEQGSEQGLWQRLRHNISQSRQRLGKTLANVILGKKVIDQALFDEIEGCLLTADVGVQTTNKLLQKLTEQVERKALTDPNILYAQLQQQLIDILHVSSEPLSHVNSQQSKIPRVFLIVGVNGSGKTTTIGKLAKSMHAQGLSVMLAAGDTFRAAAVEQLQIWGERNDIPVIAQETGADSASVIFDGLAAAQAKKVDVLIADTAGRLHTQTGLMDELKKIARVLKKCDTSAPHEIFMVLDAGIGQNALAQVEAFNEALTLTGLIITKLDGTAKGGIIFAIADKFSIPIRYIGVGEQVDDLRPFEPEQFVKALFSTTDEEIIEQSDDGKP